MNFAIFIADCKGMSVLDEQFIANLVPLHSVPSESVSAIEYANSFRNTIPKWENRNEWSCDESRKIIGIGTEAFGTQTTVYRGRRTVDTAGSVNGLWCRSGR